MSNDAYTAVENLMVEMEKEYRAKVHPILEILQAMKSTGSLNPAMSLRFKVALTNRMEEYTVYRLIFDAHKLQAVESGVMVDETNELIKRFEAIVTEVEAMIQQL